MDLYRITHPLRLARGSHQPGSGKGCAMNVISYITGDEQVTDFPTRSARPLSLLVQTSNDLLKGPAGYLSPDDSVLALDLAWQTVGTADVPDTVVHAWIAELLTSPTWGQNSAAAAPHWRSGPTAPYQPRARCPAIAAQFPHTQVVDMYIQDVRSPAGRERRLLCRSHLFNLAIEQ
jgi:hypothetical protein